MSEALSSIMGGGEIFGTLSGFALSTLNMIMPYAIGIFAAMFCWIVIKNWFLQMITPKIQFYKNYFGFYDSDIEEVEEEQEEDLSGNLRGYDDL